MARWLTVVPGANGAEHGVLTHGGHRVRLDLPKGHLCGQDAVDLRFALEGLAAVEDSLLPLQKLTSFLRHGRFTSRLCRGDTAVVRGLVLLQVRDGLVQGASQRDLAAVLFGTARVAAEWNGASDSLRSRVRRLARNAQAMARGGYRQLLGGGQGDRKAPSTGAGLDPWGPGANGT
ncbi:DUF2285 domain-containing protein [Novosphingobium gossypii]|uniref:DUF2285 domain-containing protein n=1 Tax=Novosphingobium gossypii TaxID=1604774 RepID=UPI003D194C03